MTNAQTLQIRHSEIGERLNILSEPSKTLTAEERSEMDGLRVEYRDVGAKHRAAIELDAAAPVPEPGQVIDTELRERLELRSKARLSNFVIAAMRGRRIDGAEAELSDACGARGDIPLEFFQPDPREAVEERTVTSAPGTVGVNVAPVQPFVFAPSIAQFLGIDMPMVGSGTFSQARINAALSADSEAKGAAAAATAATFAVKSATPKRISARLELLAEDVAAAGVSNFESALRQNLTMALSAELDKQMIVGAGAGNDLEGLLHGLTAATADGTTLTFQHGITKMAALVDGLWATENRAHPADRRGGHVPPGGWRVRRVPPATRASGPLPTTSGISPAASARTAVCLRWTPRSSKGLPSGPVSPESAPPCVRTGAASGFPTCTRGARRPKRPSPSMYSWATCW